MPRDENGRFAKHKPRAHPLAEKAFVFIELDRATGESTMDQEMSTPAETTWMLEHELEKLEEKYYDRRESE